ncbi:MAG: cyclic-di-AMP receptor [Ruminococcus sp.]|jgi:uncharacterized protein YaaQ|nr:cyclic-di-AMP receptor [Ruminococcus sp.]
MKLVYAIVNKSDSKRVAKHLTNHGFYVTTLASVGGFSDVGNMTLLICDEDEKVPQIINIIKRHSKERSEYITPTGTCMPDVQNPAAAPLKITVGGAVIIVTEVTQFLKI